MLLLNLIPQLIPPTMAVPDLLLRLRYLIPQSVHLCQVRVRSLPSLVLGLYVLE